MIERRGAPLTINRTFGEDVYVFAAGIPVPPGTEAEEGSPIRIEEMPGSRAVRAIHVGPYTGLAETHKKAEAYLKSHRYQQSGPSWEEYVSDPSETPKPELVTWIFIPIAEDRPE